jgi:ElaB/YqjD/DUF883 family membrane-anchored ribosome-binding protein
MADMKDRIKSGIDIGADKAKNATDRLADAGNGAQHEGQKVVDRIKEGAQDLGNRARDTIENWAGEAGDTARQVGQKVQNWADDAYETASEKVGDFGKEVTTLIRNHPIPAVLIGLGIGVLLGRTARII